MADNKSSFISSDSNELNHNQSINDELVGHVKPELISQVTNIKIKQTLQNISNNKFEILNDTIQINKTTTTISQFGSSNISAMEMDEKRKNTATHAFLIKMAEAREWVNTFVPCATVIELLDNLPTGVYLAQIAKLCGHKCRVHERSIENFAYLEVENIYAFLQFAKNIGLSSNFLFETNDLREGKNLKQVIYCLHATAMLLKRKGIGPGIKKPTQSFTEEEMNMIDQHQTETIDAFDNLENELNKLDGIAQTTTNNYENQNIMLNTDERDSIKRDSISRIQSCIDTLLFLNAFRNILYNNKINLISLKKFIFLMPCDQPELIGTDIIEQFRCNFTLKTRIDNIYRNVRLLLSNQSILRGISNKSMQKTEDLSLFQKALYLFLIQYELIKNLITEKEEIPLELIYPDSVIGDYHFTKLISLFNLKYINENNDIILLVQQHFRNSKMFKELVNLFNSKEELPNINPVEIYKELYNLQIHDQKALIETAMGEEKVRKEINSRCEIFKDYLEKIITYFNNTNFPIYCNLFINKWEIFIEDIVLNSNNKKYAVLFKKIYNNTLDPNILDDFNDDIMFIFNKMSPLYEFITTYNIKVPNCLFKTEDDINSALIQHLEYADNLKFNFTYDTINMLVFILKKHKDRFKGVLRRMTEEVSVFNHKNETVNIVIDNSHMNYDDQNELYSGLSSIISETKKKLVLLIKNSKKRDIMSMLFSDKNINTDNIDSDETGCYSSDFTNVNISTRENLNNIKKSLIADLKFLESEGITFKRNKYNEILDMIAKDILKPENKDVELTGEIAELVYQQGEALMSNLMRLEEYYNSFIAKYTTGYSSSIRLFVNKDKLLNQELESAEIIINEIKPTFYQFEIISNNKPIVTDHLYLTDILKLKEEGNDKLEIGKVVKMDLKTILFLINSKYVVY
ncbi:hypothetical protein EBI_24862 [Enterocytozoon bieneusi H348]|nr:hypothetical protein EBI_24862 [Enterocytozoon bieneusi H348]|eukprot:XP_002649430.1 hypothetical protein EBI_24862 [Enterocytozoon bieneusi H348]